MAKHVHIHLGTKDAGGEPKLYGGEEEDRKRAALLREVEQTLSTWKRKSEEIGGSFRSPALQRNIRNILKKF